MNALKLINIIELRGVNHNMFHNILMKASIYAILIVPTKWLSIICWRNLRIISYLDDGKSSFSSSSTSFSFDISDGCPAALSIHRGIHVMVLEYPQDAMSYKNKRQENLEVSCTCIIKYYECYPTNLY